jgi:hypothetical protein
MAPAQKETTIAVRVTLVFRERCEAAADAAGLTLADWTRFVLLRAVSEGAFAPPKKRKK